MNHLTGSREPLIPSSPYNWGVYELERGKERKELEISLAMAAIAAAAADIKPYDEISERRNHE